MFRKELVAVASAPAFILLLIALCLLTGYSFIQAASLFSQASRSATGSPAMARGLSPFDGLLVPTFGAVYLTATLLYPFLAIRSIALEKESGSLKLLLQYPLSTPMIILIKLSALAAAWLAMLCVPLSAVVLWTHRGGHISGLELCNLLLGHSLYGFAITGLAFLSASLTGSTAAAAILVLAAVVGNWAMDFSVSQGGWLREAAAFSLTACLRSFERGLLDCSKASILLFLGGTSSALCAVWLQIGRPFSAKSRATAAIVALGLAAGWLMRLPRIAKDVTEDRRNSFSAADEKALSELDQPLIVRVYLSPDDSRLVDLERVILSKLRRIVPRIGIRLEPTESAALGSSANDNYGLIVLEYGGKTGETRSTSEEEVLPILYGLAGKKFPAGTASDYPGYPLAANFGNSAWWFYLVLPALLGLGWSDIRRRR